MKTVLFMHHGRNPVMLDDLQATLSLLGPEYRAEHRKVNSLKLAEAKSIPVEDYAAVIFTVPFVALHSSGGEALSATKNIIARAPEGRLFLQTSDVKLSMDAKMWDVGATAEERENPYLARPFKVLASIAPAALQDVKACEKFHRLWMKKLHPESELLSAEFTVGLVDFLPAKIHAALETARARESKSLFESPKRTIERFYYGIDKAGLRKSLKAMGLGESADDAVFGNIGKLFLEVPDLAAGNRNKNAMDQWIGYAADAKVNLYPYELFKGDYQFTRRSLELAVLAPDSVRIDPQVSPYVREFTREERWWEKFAEVRLQLQGLMA